MLAEIPGKDSAAFPGIFGLNTMVAGFHGKASYKRACQEEAFQEHWVTEPQNSPGISPSE